MTVSHDARGPLPPAAGAACQTDAPPPAVPAACLLTVARLARLLERASSELGLSLAHYRVLALVGGGDQRASRLADRLVLGKPAVTAAVDALVERGLLVRSQVTGDRRGVHLDVTAAGHDVLAQAEASMRRRLGEVLGHCAAPEAVVGALGDLGDALDDCRSATIGSPRAATDGAGRR